MIDLLLYLCLLPISLATVIFFCAGENSKKSISSSKSKTNSKESFTTTPDEIDWTLFKKVDSCAGCKRRFDDGPVVACHQQLFHFTCPCKCGQYKRLKNGHDSVIAMFTRKAPDAEKYRPLNMSEDLDRKIYDHVLKEYNDSVESKRKHETEGEAKSRLVGV